MCRHQKAKEKNQAARLPLDNLTEEPGPSVLVDKGGVHEGVFPIVHEEYLQIRTLRADVPCLVSEPLNDGVPFPYDAAL